MDTDGSLVIPRARQCQPHCLYLAGKCPDHDRIQPDAAIRLVNEASMLFNDGDLSAAHDTLIRASQLPSVPLNRLRNGIRMIDAARFHTDPVRGYCRCPQFKARQHLNNPTCLHLTRAGY